MYQQRLLVHIYPLVFALVLLIPRIANLHALDHVEDEDTTPISCELCDILVHSFQLDLITHDYDYVQNKGQHVPTSFIVYTTYDISQENIVSPTSVYNKPPPVL